MRCGVERACVGECLHRIAAVLFFEARAGWRGGYGGKCVTIFAKYVPEATIQLGS